MGDRGAEPVSGGCFACRARRDHAFACLAADETLIPDREKVPHVYAVGQTLFYQGNPALAVYCVQSGAVRLTREAGRHGEVVIGTRSAGDLVGFRAVFAAMPYGLTAVTLETSRICAIPREAFLRLVCNTPSLALELLRRLARRSRVTEEQLVSRARLPVVARAANLLLSLCHAEDANRERLPQKPDMSREEMALLLGTTRETLSRMLNRLAARGVLDLSDSQIQVLDPAALRRIAGS